jgi:hypothetical protein
MMATRDLLGGLWGTMASAPKSAIYTPPKEGFPFLVVTLKDDGEIMSFMRAKSRDEARAILEKGEIKPENVLVFPNSPWLHF